MRKLPTAVAAMVLALSGCTGSEASDDDDIEISFSDDSDFSDGITAGSGDGEGNDAEPDDDDGDEVGSDGFMTVFGLPPGSSVEAEWAPYTLVESEFGVSESVAIEVTGATIDEIISFYETSLAEMGYVVGTRLELGESIAINISDPASPGTTAVIQAGMTGDFVTVNQNKTVPALDETGSGDGEDPQPAETTSDDAASSTSASAEALTAQGTTMTVDWGSLNTPAFFDPASQNSDPFFHIHSHGESDAFFLSFEMFTEWGQAWQGETGTFDISCADAATSTGICPYFDADGPGPQPVLGEDFATTGSMTINKLDDSGYDLVVHELVFSDGTSFNEFTLMG